MNMYKNWFVKREALELIETCVDEAEDAELIAKNFAAGMMDPILGDYDHSVCDVLEPEVFSMSMNKCVSQHSLFVDLPSVDLPCVVLPGF